MARQPRTGPTVRPIAHLSLVDRVSDELHRAILNGDIKPGTVVSIVELCEQFDVSHIPVREALRRLESEGMVSLRPGRSALVASLSIEELTDVYRLRKLIEGDLVVRATADLTADQLARAGVALDHYTTIGREPADLAEAHRAFRAALLENVAGPADTRVLDLLWRSSDRYLHIVIGALDRASETTETRHDEHHHLLELARAGKAEDLRDAWLSDLESTETQLRAVLVG